jgi:signal transduction histidine kinase
MIERIRAAGGDAWIESKVGAGTSVSFTVPVAAPRTSPAPDRS